MEPHSEKLSGISRFCHRREPFWAAALFYLGLSIMEPTGNIKPSTKIERTLMASMTIPLFTLLVMALVKYTEVVGHVDFGGLGVLPRVPKGLLGIVTGPLVHGDMQHLMNNALSLFLFGTALFYFYRRVAIKVWLIIYFVSGSLIWLFARGGYSHIGISGVIYGLGFFLFFGGVLKKNRRLAVLSLLLTFFYGSMIWGVLPGDPRISWEGHLSGAVVGVVLAVYYRNTYVGIEHFDQRKPYNGPDLIGDEWREDASPQYGISYPPEPEQQITIRYVFKPQPPKDDITTQE